jgi:hypothetical protein
LFPAPGLWKSFELRDHFACGGSWVTIGGSDGVWLSLYRAKTAGTPTSASHGDDENRALAPAGQILPTPCSKERRTE